MKTIKLILKILRSYMVKEEIGFREYEKEYDKISETYKFWMNFMSGNTGKIIYPQAVRNYISAKKEIKILDFACGTGFITSKLLGKLYDSKVEFKIDCVDVSSGMLEIAKKNIEDPRANFIHEDGLGYLNKNDEKYDLIYIGWAFPYFQNETLLKLIHSNLKKGGIYSMICNTRETLKGVEKAFIKLMSVFPQYVEKPMNIKNNLPINIKNLNRLLEKNGFKFVEGDAGVEKVKFQKAENLLEWLEKTGAIAGTREIFRVWNKDMEDELKKDLKKYCEDSDGILGANHSFVYGVYESV